MTHPLHFDYLAKHFPRRTRDVQATIDAGVLPWGINRLTEHLMGQGAFPAEAVSLVLRSNHQLRGRQTFEVGPILSELLEHTDLRSVTAEELRFPYQTFYVNLPDSDLSVWGGERTGWHQVAGFYCHLEDDCLTVLVWGGENERSLGPGDDATQWVAVNLDQDGLPDDADLETMIARCLQKPNRRDDPVIDPLYVVLEGTHEDGLEGERYDRQMDTLARCIRIAVNLAMYLASPKADVAERPDKGLAKLRRRAESSRGPRRRAFEAQLARRTIIQRVGASIEGAMREHRERHGPVSGTWVRGHWRSYWTGPGRTVKVSRWILPHPRGLEQPEARSYDLEDSP